MNHFKKIMINYLLKTILCIPIMFAFFGLSIMMYDSGMPDDYFYHCELVYIMLWTILFPSFIIIASNKESFNFKGINISYGLNYLIGGIVAFVPGFIFSLIHLSPSNIIELILAILTPISVILTFCIINYLYNKMPIIQKLFKLLLILVILYIMFAPFLSFFI